MTVFYSSADLMERISSDAYRAEKLAAREKAAQERVEARREAKARKAFVALIHREAISAASRASAIGVVITKTSVSFEVFSGEYLGRVGLTPGDIMSSARSCTLMRVRRIVFWVGFNRCHRSLSWLGRRMLRDHSSVMHSVRKIDRLIEDRGLAVPSDPLAAALYLNRELGGVQ